MGIIRSGFSRQKSERLLITHAPLAPLARSPRPCIECLEGRRLLAAIPAGGEFLVNTYTTNFQIDAAAVMDADGDFIIVWSGAGSSDLSGVFAQRYNSAGIAQGTEFRVNSYTTGSAGSPSVAMDSVGNFVVAWQSSGQESAGNTGVYARRYDSAGDAQGTEFHVNTYTTSFQSRASLAMDSAGDFVVTWTSRDQDGSSDGIYAQRYDAAGVPQGTEFRVNTYTTGIQNFSSVAMDDTGEFIVTWQSAAQDGDDYGIYAQRYDAVGVAQSTEFRVNTYTSTKQFSPAVAMDASGDFVIAWISRYHGPVFYGLYAQRYDSAGDPQGSEFWVNSSRPSDFQYDPVVAMDIDGNFMVVSSSFSSSGPGTAGRDVVARRYNGTGVQQGAEFRVNTYTTNEQRFPTVAMDAGGDLVVAWTSSYQEDSYLGHYGVYAQRYTIVPVVTSASFVFDISPQRLRVTFDEDVSGSLSVGDVALQKLPSGSVPPMTMLAYGVDGANTATFTFETLLDDGFYHLTLEAAGITTSAGNAMPADYVMGFHVLAADANHDRTVNLYDLVILATNWQGTGKTFSQGDFNYDGVVNSSDLAILATHWQVKLDVPPPAAPPVPTSTRSTSRTPARTPTRVVDLIN